MKFIDPRGPSILKINCNFFETVGDDVLELRHSVYIFQRLRCETGARGLSQSVHAVLRKAYKRDVATRLWANAMRHGYGHDFFMLTERATVKPQVGKPDIPSASE